MPLTRPVTWVLESDAFSDRHAAMRRAILELSHSVLEWNDDWLCMPSRPRLDGQSVVFHGSLGNAAAVAQGFGWNPGSYCDVSRFLSSVWYPVARPWLLHQDWVLTTAAKLVADPATTLDPLGRPSSVFVRPDSPLKPFSGRVVRVEAMTLASLDYGFYYEDENLPIIVAPVREVGREWRYVVVSGEIVAGSAYAAESRSALPDDPGGEAWRFAAEIARTMVAPQDVYVLDVCKSGDGLHLLEINPFSGADLYACERVAIVRSVAGLVTRG